MRAIIATALVMTAVAVGCSDDEGGVKTVTVTDTSGGGGGKPPEKETDKAEGRVSEHGFTQKGGTVWYGLVVTNPSRSAEAQEIEITINGVDANGNVAATDNASVSVIPPKTDFNVGGELDVGSGDQVKDLEIDVQTGGSGAPEHPLPEVSNVRLDPEEYGGLTVRAQVENTLSSNLSSIADVFAVVRDRKGEIIAGGFTFPTNDIPPGRRAAVSVNFTEDIPGAADADMSADNETAE